MRDDGDEVAKFGRELAEGGNPEIGRGGTLAQNDKEKEKDKDKDKRKPPHGRSHAVV